MSWNSKMILLKRNILVILFKKSICIRNEVFTVTLAPNMPRSSQKQRHRDAPWVLNWILILYRTAPSNSGDLHVYLSFLPPFSCLEKLYYHILVYVANISTILYRFCLQVRIISQLCTLKPFIGKNSSKLTHYRWFNS